MSTIKQSQLKPSDLSTAEKNRRLQNVVYIIAAVFLLYMFLVAVKAMGQSFKLFGSGFEETLIRETSNPFIGLFVGVLATSIVQSSSTTTAMVVAFVASGTLTVEIAVPIIMGANVGTTITGILVAFVHVTRKDEFERAFAAATVQEFFKVLTVLVLLPLELMTGFLRHCSVMITEMFTGSSGGFAFRGPLGFIVDPVANRLEQLCCLLKHPYHGVVLLIVSVMALAFALYMLTRIMKTVTMSGAEKGLHTALNSSPMIGLLLGMVITAIIQSSSVTTSLMVPMAAAGLLTVEQVFPVALGANVGTTITALLASLAGNAAGLTIAIVHTLFNVFGILLFYAIPYTRKLPLFLANYMGAVAKKSPLSAVLFVVLPFFVVPGLLIFLWNL